MKEGEVITKSSKQGGGQYIIVGIVNCERCNAEIAEREITEPTKQQRKRGRYYSEYLWCHKCGLYVPNKKSKEIII